MATPWPQWCVSDADPTPGVLTAQGDVNRWTDCGALHEPHSDVKDSLLTLTLDGDFGWLCRARQVDEGARAVGYFWNYNDNDARVTTGANGTVNVGRVIQRPDAYGGYNAEFGIAQSVAYYHVHFASGSTQVTTVRYFGGGGGQGDNVVTYNANPESGYGPTDRRNLGGLATWLTAEGYPNHAQLMTKLKNAVPAGRLPNNEIA
jgi:hypothetical protein